MTFKFRKILTALFMISITSSALADSNLERLYLSELPKGTTLTFNATIEIFPDHHNNTKTFGLEPKKWKGELSHVLLTKYSRARNSGDIQCILFSELSEHSRIITEGSTFRVQESFEHTRHFSNTPYAASSSQIVLEDTENSFLALMCRDLEAVSFAEELWLVRHLQDVPSIVGDTIEVLDSNISLTAPKGVILKN